MEELIQTMMVILVIILLFLAGFDMLWKLLAFLSAF